MLLGRALEVPIRWVLWSSALCLCYAPVSENLRNGQAYLLVFLMLSLLTWSLTRSRASLGSVSLGLMVVLKAAGARLRPLLLWERRWRALLVGGLTVAAVALTSMAWIGLDPWLK